MPILNKRIGFPVNVNTRSEFGILDSHLKTNENQVHYDKHILASSKSMHHSSSSLGRKKQTKKPLLRWEIRSQRRNKQKGNDDSSFRVGAYKSSCCKNKPLKKNKKNLNTRQKPFPTQTKLRSTLHNDDANHLLRRETLNDHQIMHPYINGSYVHFIKSIRLYL